MKGRHLGQAGGGLDYQGLKVGFLGSLAATVGGEAQRPSSGAPAWRDRSDVTYWRPLQRPVRLVAVEQLAMNKNLVMFASVIS